MMTEDRDKWRKYVHGVATLRIEDGQGTEEMMGLQWHQLDHVQIICTSIQTDNHTNISPPIC